MHEGRSAMAHAIEDGRDGAAERSQRSIPALIPVSGPGPSLVRLFRERAVPRLGGSGLPSRRLCGCQGASPRAYSISGTDDQLGGLWAVIATLFTYRSTYQQSVAAALSRMDGTSAGSSRDHQRQLRAPGVRSRPGEPAYPVAAGQLGDAPALHNHRLHQIAPQAHSETSLRQPCPPTSVTYLVNSRTLLSAAPPAARREGRSGGVDPSAGHWPMARRPVRRVCTTR